MKKLMICLTIVALPLMAAEISLGMVSGVEGNSLILADGLRISISNLALGRYITADNQPVDPASITFPFTASLVVNTELPEHIRKHRAQVKIHRFYDIIDGRLVERKLR
jgi:hypothetical protein